MYMSYDEMQANGYEYAESIYTEEFADGVQKKLPVCYNTESLKYGQTAYFIAVVVI